MSQEKRASFAQEDMKAGGGNLWGTAGPVRARIIGGRFTKEAPDNYQGEGNPIFGVVDFELAGDAPIEERKVNQSFSLGGSAGDNFAISPDGNYLVPTNDDAAVIKDSKFGTFASSLQNEGVSKAIMASFSFDQIVGLDGDFKRIADKERVFQNANKRQSKFPPSTLCLVKLYGIGTTAAVGKTAATGNTATPATTADAGPVDLDNETLPYLEAALKAAGGTLQRGRVTLAVSKQAMKDPHRALYAGHAAKETYLASLVEAGIITYDTAAKGQPVSLAA